MINDNRTVWIGRNQFFHMHISISCLIVGSYLIHGNEGISIFVPFVEMVDKLGKMKCVVLVF